MTPTAHKEARKRYYAKNKVILCAKQTERNMLRQIREGDKVPIDITLSERLALAEIEKHIQLLGDNPALTVDKIKETMKRAGFPCESGNGIGVLK